MSVKDYIDTIAPTPDWLQEIGQEAKRKARQSYHEADQRRDCRRPPGASPENSSKQPGQMIRLVLDTNIIVSAYLNQDGLPFFIMKLGLAGVVQLCASEAIFAEYDELLQRKSFPLDRRRSRLLLKKLRIASRMFKRAGRLTVTPRSFINVWKDLYGGRS